MKKLKKTLGNFKERIDRFIITRKYEITYDAEIGVRKRRRQLEAYVRLLRRDGSYVKFGKEIEAIYSWDASNKPSVRYICQRLDDQLYPIKLLPSFKQALNLELKKYYPK